MRIVVRLALLSIVLAPVSALAQNVHFGPVQRQGSPGMRQADRHNPFSPRYINMQPNGAVNRGVLNTSAPPPVNNGGGGHHHHHQHGYCPPNWGWGGYSYVPLVGWRVNGVSIYTTNTSYYGNMAYGSMLYSPYADYSYGYPLFPAVDISGIYGLGAWDQTFAPAETRSVRRNNVSLPVDPDAILPAPADDAQRMNTHRNDLAARYIEFGDKQFLAGDYNQAQSRYRKAADIAPTQALPRVRRGQTFIALGKYPQAADELYRAMQSEPDWINSKFKLQSLYRDRPADLDAHLQALAQALNDKPGDPDLAFLLGWELFFMGRPTEARPHFEQAVAMGTRDKLIGGLLALTEPPKAVAKIVAPPPPVKKPAAMPGAPVAQPPVDEPDLPADEPAQQEVRAGVEI